MDCRRDTNSIPETHHLDETADESLSSTPPPPAKGEGRLPPEAREALYAEFAFLVGRLLRQYGGRNRELCQELEGEIYCQFCQVLEAYDPGWGVPLRPYIIRQLSADIYTFARQLWRCRQREVRLHLEQTSEESRPAPPLVDPTPQWDAAIAMAQVCDVLPEVIASLPARQRAVLVWRYYEEQSIKAIAARLGVRQSTVRSLLRHGLNNLRKKFGTDRYCL